jgi:hypothetical protein
MPTGTTPTGTGEVFGPFYVSHTNGVQFLISVQEGSYPPADQEEATQDMINYLTAWPDRDTMYAVESTKTETQTYAITADPAE